MYLLQIATHFDVSQYTLRRQENCLDKLLKLLEEIVSKHNEPNVLEECSRCLAYLCDEDVASSVYVKCSLR